MSYNTLASANVISFSSLMGIISRVFMNREATDWSCLPHISGDRGDHHTDHRSSLRQSFDSLFILVLTFTCQESGNFDFLFYIRVCTLYNVQEH